MFKVYLQSKENGIIVRERYFTEYSSAKEFAEKLNGYESSTDQNYLYESTDGHWLVGITEVPIATKDEFRDFLLAHGIESINIVGEFTSACGIDYIIVPNREEGECIEELYDHQFLHCHLTAEDAILMRDKLFPYEERGNEITATKRLGEWIMTTNFNQQTK